MCPLDDNTLSATMTPRMPSPPYRRICDPHQLRKLTATEEYASSNHCSHADRRPPDGTKSVAMP